MAMEDSQGRRRRVLEQNIFGTARMVVAHLGFEWSAHALEMTGQSRWLTVR